MSKHTPGPWISESPTRDGTSVKSTAALFSTVAWCGAGSIWSSSGSYEISHEEAEANARLIAAAPDLLEVAKLLLDFYNLETQLFVEKYGHGITTRILGDRARAAIAKATGANE